jgi:hypothetical protein
MTRRLEPSRLLPLAAGVKAKTEGSTAGAERTARPSPREEPAAPLDSDSEDKSEQGDDEDSDRYQVELKQVQLDLKAGYIKGEANNIEAIEAFNAELKKRPCFMSVETSDTTRLSFGDREDWLRFQIRIDIDCSPEEDEKEER